MIERYFDNAATTPVDPRVLREMLPYLETEFGNAHSIHGFGRSAMAAVELARQRVAHLIGAEDPSQVIFTSGASEANSWLFSAYPDAVVSPFEHSSIHEIAKQGRLGTISNRGVELRPPEEPVELLSVMAVNNEIGTIWDVRELAGRARRLHVDATQAVGKIPFSVEGLDYCSFSAHKIYGPKGIGALYIRDEAIPPLIAGGEQERRLRGGTLNVPAIVGFGAAAAIAIDESENEFRDAERLNTVFLDELSEVPEVELNGGGKRSPFILSLSFAEVEGETLIVEADQGGYAVSGGAACSSNSTEPSHVLVALELEERYRRGTVRVSFGRFNDLESACGLGRAIKSSVKKLRTMAVSRNNTRNGEWVVKRH